MERALILCDAPKASEFYMEFFSTNGCRDVTLSDNAADAKRRLAEKGFDLVLINSPLRVASAEEVAIDIAVKNESQVLVMVKNEYLEETTAMLKDYGIIIVGKPVHVRELSLAIKFAEIAECRINMIRRENKNLLKKLNETKLVGQAKLLLMQYEHLSEEDAHKKIERTAMDTRRSRAAVAKEVIELYE